MKRKIKSLILGLSICLSLCLMVPAMVSSAAAIGYPYSIALSPWHNSNSNATHDPVEVKEITGLNIFSDGGSDSPYSLNPARYGLKDDAGNIVIPTEYAGFSAGGEGKFIGARQRSLGDEQYFVHVFAVGSGARLYNGEGLRSIYYFEEQQVYILYKQNQFDEISHTGEEPRWSYGILDENLNELLPLQYNGLDYIDDGYFYLRKSVRGDDGYYHYQYGVYKNGGTVNIPCGDFDIRYIGNDMFRVRRSDFYSCAIDGAGKQVLPYLYADVMAYKEHRFTVALFRSEADYLKAKSCNLLWEPQGDPTAYGENLNGSASLFEGYGYDLSKTPSSAVRGVIDENQNILTSFIHERVGFDEKDNVRLGSWNGKSGIQRPFAGYPGFENIACTAKEYDWEVVPLSSLTPTGQTVTDFLMERSVHFPGYLEVGNTPAPPAPTVGGFTDVKETDYFADAVLWAVEKKITSGTGETTFSPSVTCSKGQVLTFLWRANGSPEPTAGNPFNDIETGDYFYKAALWAAEKGLVSGSVFGADTDCTRAMTMEFMWKAAGSPAPAGKAEFADVPVHAGYAQAVAWAVEQNITSGTGNGNFSPAATCTRGEIVTFLHRALGK